jgi:hypothetical protein
LSRIESLFKKAILEGPETVNPPFTSNSIDIDGIVEGFAISFRYENGVAVNMVLGLEVSIDGENFVPMNADQAITDTEGTHIWDVEKTNTSFVRVTINGTGSIDIQNIIIVAKRGH